MKLSPPRVSEAVLRPEALRLVAEGARRRLLVVCAPAGYGKSTLVAEASRRLKWPAVWYKLGALDHDPGMLFATLIEAIRSSVPGFAERLHARLTAGEDPPLHELLVAFVVALVEDTRSELFVILDDYHEAADSDELNRALEYCLANLPSNVHFVLLTRYEPAFPLSRFRLAGEVTELSYSSLRFDAQQIRQLFAKRHVALDREQTEHLLVLTEGWPVSVVLAADTLKWLDMSSVGDALTNPRLKRDSYAYLAEQVLAREPHETRQFLKATCCLDTITVDLANEVTGGEASFRQLDHLTRNRVFTFVDADGTSYRYHNLFREFLRHKCVQEDGLESFRAVQVRTAHALRMARSFELATELYLAANCPDDALQCLAEGGEATMDDCRSSTLTSWLDRLPAEAARGNPWARLLEGQIRMRDSHHDSALALFAEAERAFDEARDDWGMYQTLSLTECALYWKGYEKEAAVCCQRALGYANTDEQVVHTLISLGFIMVNACDWPEVDALWARISQIRKPPPHEQARFRCQRVHAALVRGDFRTAMETGNNTLKYLDDHATAAMRTPFLNTLALTEIDCGEYLDARAHLDECLAGCQHYGLAHIGKMAIDTLGLCLLAVGDFEGGIELIQEAADDPAFGDDIYCLPSHFCHLGTAWRRCGELGVAARYFQRALSCPGIESFPSVYLNCIANAEFTLSLIRGQSTRSLERAGANARALGLGFVDLKVQFFSAVLEHDQSQQSDVGERLAAIVPAQHKLGHVSFLSHELALHPDLVVTLLTQDQPDVEDAVIDALARHYQAADLLETAIAVSERVGLKCLGAAKAHCDATTQQRILARARRSKFAAVRRSALQERTRDTVRATGVPGFPELTRREHEVLALIADGKTNPELAGHLCLSPPTVKTHVNHIFSKLGVRDRVGAVIAFRERIEALNAKGDGDLL